MNNINNLNGFSLHHNNGFSGYNTLNINNIASNQQENNNLSTYFQSFTPNLSIPFT